MLVVPLTAQPSQTVTVTLANQTCQINVYEKTTYCPGTLPNTWTPVYKVYMDLYVSNALIIGGVRCLSGVRMVRDAYLGFIGDLAFYDTQGSDDPVASGLGSRFQLVYLEATDLAEASV